MGHPVNDMIFDNLRDEWDELEKLAKAHKDNRDALTLIRKKKEKLLAVYKKIKHEHGV